MNDTLVKKAAKGDPDSFAQIVSQVRDQAYKIAFCYLHNEADSMDAVCDAVEKAYRNIRKLKEPKYFCTWFVRIVINECKLQIRSKQKVVLLADRLYGKQQTASLDDFTVNITEGVNTEVSFLKPGGNVSSVSHEEKLDLEGLLKKLSSVDRVLIYMKYYMGYTLEEISEVMEMPSGTVKTRIYSNLKVMKSKLEPKEV